MLYLWIIKLFEKLMFQYKFSCKEGEWWSSFLGKRCVVEVVGYVLDGYIDWFGVNFDNDFLFFNY